MKNIWDYIVLPLIIYPVLVYWWFIIPPIRLLLIVIFIVVGLFAIFDPTYVEDEHYVRGM